MDNILTIAGFILILLVAARLLVVVTRTLANGLSRPSGGNPRSTPGQGPGAPAFERQGRNRRRVTLDRWRERDRDHLRARKTPRDRRREWGLPVLDDPASACSDLLGLDGMRALAHLCNVSGARAPAGTEARWANYRVRQVRKRGGGVRLIHAPKPRLKAAQRRILREILDRVPVHQAATGFRRGGSPEEHARRHAGRRIIACWDVADYFPSIDRGRVTAMFTWLGYPLSVARVLSLLCTARGPDIARPWRRVLPQGAPTSPAIANIVCFRLDARLSGVARQFGGHYSRYADDLAFSGGNRMKNGLPRMIPLVERILGEEGFRARASKRRFMRRGRRQQLTGLTVNTTVGLGRGEYDRLRAILHQAKATGSLESQNRHGHRNYAAHIRSRIDRVRRYHPGKGDKLLAAWQALPPATPQAPAQPAAPPPE